ncbi:MAG: DUF86 domain-containing protein [Candidatus Desantisbacteria bacterium]
MNRNIMLYLKYITDNMEKAEIFVQDMTYDEFTNDEKTCYAVMRCIEIMGEAVKHIPMDIRQKYSQIPWRDMAGMRDKVIHFYFGVNFGKIWLVVKEDIPELKPLINAVLSDLLDENNHS